MCAGMPAAVSADGLQRQPGARGESELMQWGGCSIMVYYEVSDEGVCAGMPAAVSANGLLRQPEFGGEEFHRMQIASCNVVRHLNQLSRGAQWLLLAGA